MKNWKLKIGTMILAFVMALVPVMLANGNAPLNFSASAVVAASAASHVAHGPTLPPDPWQGGVRV